MGAYALSFSVTELSIAREALEKLDCSSDLGKKSQRDSILGKVEGLIKQHADASTEDRQNVAPSAPAGTPAPPVPQAGDAGSSMTVGGAEGADRPAAEELDIATDETAEEHNSSSSSASEDSFSHSEGSPSSSSSSSSTTEVESSPSEAAAEQVAAGQGEGLQQEEQQAGEESVAAGSAGAAGE